MNNEVSLNPEKCLDFMFGGKSLFTILNESTGNRFTYTLENPKDKENIYFLNVFKGTENTNKRHYRYVGMFTKNLNFYITKNSKFNLESVETKALLYVVNKLKTGSLPSFIKVFHHGKCGHCGRTLTVPSSILSGLGPKCASYLKS